MSEARTGPAAGALRQTLEAWLARSAPPDDAELSALDAAGPEVLDGAIADLVRGRGAEAGPLLSSLAAGSHRHVRRAARRGLYRLAQRGAEVAPPPAPSRPVVERRAERPVRAWISGVDGSGSRAVWIVFEGGFGELRLCSLILNDVAGILEVSGGDITRKRLDRELAALRAEQKLPWVETDPARIVGLVAEALTLHSDAAPAPAAFARWRSRFASAPPAEAPPLPPEVDAAALERTPTLLELPELAGWFLDPDEVQADAVDLLQARESRLVVADHIKAEREEAIVGRVVERLVTGEARSRWTRRLLEMGLIFEATGRAEQAGLARAAAAALADPGREPRRHPFVQALATRGLELASEVALGRVSASDVSRRPRVVEASAPTA